MGLGGTFNYALGGFVDIRLAMIILGGSLFGIQIGAIGTTYVKDYMVKFVMAVIMILVLVSRFFYIPGYLSELGTLVTVDQGTRGALDGIGLGTLAFALIFGAAMILQALYKGMREHRLAEAAALAAAGPVVAAVPRGWPRRPSSRRWGASSASWWPATAPSSAPRRCARR